VGLGYSDRVGGEVRYYSVEEAARVLRLTPERVLEMIEVGEIEGIPASGPEGWRIPIHGDASVPPPLVTTTPADHPTGHSEARDLLEEPEELGEPPATIEEARQSRLRHRRGYCRGESRQCYPGARGQACGGGETRGGGAGAP
jgi:excisionase family DNA binding protein